MADEDMGQLGAVDWRFTEFTSAPAHVLYSTCGELLAIPVTGQEVGTQLLDVVFRWLVI